MKISVVLIDGEFRGNTYAAEYCSRQDFPEDEYEIIWAEFYRNVPTTVKNQRKVKIITLEHPQGTTYHSSYCFNAGIAAAKGELVVIPDADQIVPPDFLRKLWELHSEYERLVVYPYRYDEIREGALSSLSFEELEKKCVLKNRLNYGGCLSVRKKWLLEINGYEQHKIFSGGFHANGLDVYTRFKNYGLAIMWAPHIRMYHPWHVFSLAAADEYLIQRELVRWRLKTGHFLAIDGMTPAKNCTSFDEARFMSDWTNKQNASQPRRPVKPSLMKRIFKKR